MEVNNAAIQTLIDTGSSNSFTCEQFNLIHLLSLCTLADSSCSAIIGKCITNINSNRASSILREYQPQYINIYIYIYKQ